MLEQRPLYRVATAGLDPRDVRLIEIVFRHSQYNRFAYALDARIDVEATDLLIADPSNQDGVRALAAVGSLDRSLPVIEVVHGNDAPMLPHQIPISRLTLELLAALNNAVEDELLNPGTQPLTGPHPSLLNELIAEARAEAEAREAAALEQAALERARPAAHRSDDRGAGSDMPRLASETYAATEAAAAPVAHRASVAPGVSAPRSASAVAGSASAVDARSNGHAVSARVLVVDDSPSVRQQLATALESRGLVCETVGSAALAMERLKRQHFDAAVVDIVIPDMDGFQLTKRIRRLHDGLPVIILSSRGSPFDRLRGALAGCMAYLTKPVPMRELETVLLRAFRKRLPGQGVAPAARRARSMGVAVQS